MKIQVLAILATLIAFLALGCGRGGGSSGPAPAGGERGADLMLLSGSENKSLEPLFQRFAEKNNISLHVDYLGSVDVMLQLENGAPGYDAIWPANSLWVDLGDKQKRVRHLTSIMRSPVVFGVKRSVAQKLGWIGKNVTVGQILHAAESNQLRFMMTSATQSNSGAAAYLGYLYAFAGKPEVLTHANLQDPKLRASIKRFLGTVDRSSGSSGWLKELFLQQYDRYDAMVNYEALIIETNQALVGQGKEPLYVVYPVDGLAIADSPLGYVSHDNPDKEKLFLKLQEYLLSPEVQQQILATGRRVGLAGLDQNAAPKNLFNPDWGIDAQRVLNPIKFPPAPVIQEALDLYQTAFRKPSLTAYCLDFSGSMQGEGADGVKSAMRLLLNQSEARRYLLQASDQDRTIVIPFDAAPREQWQVSGNSPKSLDSLLTRVDALAPGGGTDIYSPVIKALDDFKAEGNLDRYFPSVILMTDGKSNQGATLPDVQWRMQQLGLEGKVPIFAIMFGQADERQLRELTDSAAGRVFDGRKDLVQAFREARGYN